MNRVPKRSVSEVTRALIWDRWGRGLNAAGIARDLNVRRIRVHSVIHWHGGIRPLNAIALSARSKPPSGRRSLEGSWRVAPCVRSPDI
jgi:hypothetical protein